MKSQILKRIFYFAIIVAMTSLFVGCSDDDIGTTPLDNAYGLCATCQQGLNSVLLSGVGKDFAVSPSNPNLEISLQIQGQGGFIDWMGYPQGEQIAAQGFILNTGLLAHYSINCGLPTGFLNLSTLQPGISDIAGPDGITFSGLVLAINGNPNHIIEMDASFVQGQSQDARGQIHPFRIINHATLSDPLGQHCADIILE